VHRDCGISCCGDRTVRVMRDESALASLALERVSLFLFFVLHSNALEIPRVERCFCAWFGQ
jgi:hypothetical protein